MKIKSSFILAFLSLLFGTNYQQVFAFDLMTEAEIFYQKGDYPSAINTLENNIRQAKEKKDFVTQSQSLINLALIYLHQQNFTLADSTIKESLAIINQLDNQEKNKPKLLNFALEIQGDIEMQIATPEKSSETWEQSSKIALERGDISRFIYAEIKQVQALQELGFYRQALNKLIAIQNKLDTASQDLITGNAWLILGENLGKIGEFKPAENSLQKALDIVNNNHNDSLKANILIAQGNLTYLQNKNKINTAVEEINRSNLYLANIEKLTQFLPGTFEENIEQNKKEIETIIAQVNTYYQKAIEINNTPQTRVIANLDYLNLLINYDQVKINDSLIYEIVENIKAIETNKTTINYRLNLANKLIENKAYQYNNIIIEQLKLAYEESEQINYFRGQSLALGNLGKIYFAMNNYSEAQILGEKALYFSQKINADDLSFQWHWLLGKIAVKNQQRNEAISAYNSSLNILKNLRGDLVGLNNDLEFDFRSNIEPIYREFVDILLTESATQEEIILARNTIDSLQVAELDNFFRDACLDIKPVNLDLVIDKETAIFYPIILDDRLEVIVSIGGEILHRHTIKIEEKKLTADITILRDSLADKELQELAIIQDSFHNLYNDIIAPVKDKLGNSHIKNIVFIADGILKNIPMNALFDGEKYLIQNYNIASTPSLQLLPPQSQANSNLKAILSGLSDINKENQVAVTQNFSALPGVAIEIEQIYQLIQSQTLLNQQFTENQLRKTIEQNLSPIIHIATHGQFSSDKDNTFLLTWDEKIGINELGILFQNYNQKTPLELLVLSACQTAVGDKRATLGLAGISLKAGAKTTIASLWEVNDESTQKLMTDFYTALQNPNVSKAEALRQAQVNMINNSLFYHPSYWSAFILIGNWM